MESNNIVQVIALGEGKDYRLECENEKAFVQWTLTLRPNWVKRLRISKRGSRNLKQKIPKRNGFKNKSKITKILFKSFLKSDKAK
jgi:hypothetical protein